MPYYHFEHIKSGVIHEVFFHMNDEKIYNGESGNQMGEWRRLFLIPNASISAVKIDPFSKKDFIASTENKKYTVGELWDISSEASEKRKEKNGGVDPVKEKFYQDYQKENKVEHPEAKKTRLAKIGEEKLRKLGWDVKIDHSTPTKRVEKSKKRKFKK